MVYYRESVWEGNISQIGIFDESIRLNKLSQLRDSLECLNEVIDWEIFRPILKRAIRPDKKDGRGRPPYDEILMFKILVLQRIYNLSDDQMEFQINDRRTFMRFLGLSLGDRVPDAKTIWLFRLTKSGAIDGMFQRFEAQLEEQHLITHTGTIVDATFVEAPKQRNLRQENQAIKEGNRLKSKVRAKIEHIFARMEGSMHGITVRSIGLSRAEFNIGLMNLVYNIQRYEVLLRKQNQPNAG